MKNMSNNSCAAEFKYLLYQRRIKQNKIKNFINFKKYDIKILNPSIALPFRYINKRNQTKFHLSYKKQYVKFSSENISKFANRYNTDMITRRNNETTT